MVVGAHLAVAVPFNGCNFKPDRRVVMIVEVKHRIISYPEQAITLKLDGSCQISN